MLDVVAQFSEIVVIFFLFVIFFLALGAYILGIKTSFHFHSIRYSSRNMPVCTVMYGVFLFCAIGMCVNLLFASGVIVGSGYARSEEFLKIGHEYVVTGIVYEGILGADIEVVLLNVTLHERRIWSFQNLPPQCFVVRARYVYEADPQCKKNTPPKNMGEKPNLRAEALQMILPENGVHLEAVM